MYTCIHLCVCIYTHTYTYVILSRELDDGTIRRYSCDRASLFANEAQKSP